MYVLAVGDLATVTYPDVHVAWIASPSDCFDQVNTINSVMALLYAFVDAGGGYLLRAGPWS